MVKRVDPPATGRGQGVRTLPPPPRANPDARHRQVILRVLLAGTVVLAGAAFVATMAHTLMTGQRPDSDSPLASLEFLVVAGGLYYVSRKRFYQAAAYALIALFMAAGTYVFYRWSIDLPVGLLIYALVIVMAGILIGTRFAVATTFVLIGGLVGLGVAQGSGALHPDTSWLRQPVEASDAVPYAAMLGIIALVSWLANREIDRSLRRAQASESELKDERDNLEVRVAERTQQLEQTQLERMLELQRFAEFGRFSAGLLHDLANPLTAVSLNLEQLGEGRRSELVRGATQSLHYLERYIEAARKQLRAESEVKSFTAGAELTQVVSILAHKAKAAAVKVVVRREGNQRLYGDPVKFSQLAANLIANAIEAYPQPVPTAKPAERQVVVELRREKKALVLTVHDGGVGIAAGDIPDIFNPFYTTKRSGNRSIGIGLAMVKQIVDDDFRGSITVTSTPADGTRFAARLHDGAVPTAQ